MPDDEVLALTVANLRSEKGYDVLLEAARLSAAAGTPVRFVSVGRGPLEAELAAMVQDMGLEGRVTLLGTRTDTARLMTGAGHLRSPLAPGGAAGGAHGGDERGTAGGGDDRGWRPRRGDRRRGGTARPPHRPDLLAEAVARVARDEALRSRLADASLARSDGFDVRVAARTIEAVYDELLEGRGLTRDGPIPEPPLVLHVIPTATARGAQREAGSRHPSRRARAAPPPPLEPVRRGGAGPGRYLARP